MKGRLTDSERGKGKGEYQKINLVRTDDSFGVT